MKTVIMIFMAMVVATGTLYGQTEEQIPPVPSEEQPEVLTRGPVNEAFAHPVNTEKEGAFTVSKAPPPEIEESPPAERPVGEQFAWIPGYWAWDSDREDHIWVSGCWRAVPPGKQWVPGYWTEVADGWRWVPGFWAPVSSERIEYLPAPPAITYIEPSVTEVVDKIWVPACWYWYDGHYTLRSGYWIDAREDWVWIPSHYIWTPRGYVFVSGHWDYPLHRRGVLFAPLHFPRHINRRARYVYPLSIVVDIGNLEFGFFTRPRYRHYYFGDYYDSFYIGIGIFPWFECVNHYTWYDPIYRHRHWRNRRHNRYWRQHERNEYERRRIHKNLRPSRTYREMKRRLRSAPESERKRLEVAAHISRVVEKKKTAFRFRHDKTKVRKPVTRHANEIYRDATERRLRESSANDRKNVRSVKERVPPVKRKAIKRPTKGKRQDIIKAEPRGYSSKTREESRKTRVRDQETKRSRDIVKRESAPKRAEIRDNSSNTRGRTSPLINKKKSERLPTREQSQPDKKREEKKNQNYRKRN